MSVPASSPPTPSPSATCTSASHVPLRASYHELWQHLTTSIPIWRSNNQQLVTMCNAWVNQVVQIINVSLGHVGIFASYPPLLISYRNKLRHTAIQQHTRVQTILMKLREISRIVHEHVSQIQMSSPASDDSLPLFLTGTRNVQELVSLLPDLVSMFDRELRVKEMVIADILRAVDTESKPSHPSAGTSSTPTQSQFELYLSALLYEPYIESSHIDTWLRMMSWEMGIKDVETSVTPRRSPR